MYKLKSVTVMLVTLPLVSYNSDSFKMVLAESLCNVIYVSHQVRGLYGKVYPHVGDFFNVSVKIRSPTSLIGYQQKPSPTSMYSN